MGSQSSTRILDDNHFEDHLSNLEGMNKQLDFLQHCTVYFDHMDLERKVILQVRLEYNTELMDCQPDLVHRSIRDDVFQLYSTRLLLKRFFVIEVLLTKLNGIKK